MKAMMADFTSRHFVSDLPLSYYDLADRNDSTYTGRLVGICLMLLSTNITVFVGKTAASYWI